MSQSRQMCCISVWQPVPNPRPDGSSIVMQCTCMQGWSWVEQEWVTDTQGIADDAVDINGWSYARDFHKLTMPPAANSGKYRKVSPFTWYPHQI